MPEKNLQPTLDILMERLFEPKFTNDAFDRIKNQTIESIKNSRSRAAYVASTSFNRMNYGENHLLGFPSTGTEATVSRIVLQDVEAYYNSYLSRKDMNIIIVGEITEAESMSVMSRLSKLPGYDVALPSLPKGDISTPNTVFVYNIPKAAQSEFRVGYITDLKYDATGEYYKTNLMNFPIGGAFNCRLNLNLREDKGWTYGARGGFTGNDYTGSYLFSSGIKTPATDSALVEIVKEIRNYANNGIRPDEISFMKNAIGQSDARKYETGVQRAGFISNILKHNLSTTYVAEQNNILKNINIIELEALAKKWLQMEKMNIVIAGDMEKIKPTLEKLNYAVVELNTDGDILRER